MFTQSKSLIGLVFLILSSSVSAAETLSKPIDQLLINAVDAGNGNAYYFFFNGSGWGAPGCSQAVYVRIKEGTPGAQAILSASLTAKASGATVKYLGECHSSSTFDANYMYLQ